MVGDTMSTGILDQRKVRVKDSKALDGMRNSEADVVKLDFVNKFQNLSPARQKLMEKYFTLQETGENCPFLAEYFAVALAFTALGALLREINGSNLRKHDQQGPPKIRRMALETMLKEAMDRLQVLAEDRKVLEQRMRERKAKEATLQKERDELLRRATTAEFLVALKIQSESTWTREKEDLFKRVSDADAQRAYFFKQMTESEGHVAELQKLRAEDGKANARLVGIYASREQAWKVEKVKQAQEIESLKERNRKLNGQVKALVLHVERIAPSPETLRNRDFRRMKDSPPAKVTPEGKNPGIFPKPTEQTTAQSAVVKDLEKTSLGVTKNEQTGDSEGPVMESLSQQQEMEAELANILKKVGQLKRRGNVGKMVSTAVKESEDCEVQERAKSSEEAAIVIDDMARVDLTQDSQRKVLFENFIVQSGNIDVTPQAHDIAEKTFQLDNSFTEGCQMPAFISTERNVVESNDNEAREEHLPGGTSSQQLENGLEQVEGDLDNMIIVTSDVTQDSSKNESLLHPTLNIGAKVDRVIPVVVPDEPCDIFPLLSTSYENPNEAIVHSDSEVDISGSSHIEGVLDLACLSVDKQQDMLINSLDEELGDVQGQEENDGVNPGCKMVEPQTGDLVEEQDILINSLDEELGDVQGQEENDGVNPGCKMVEPQTGDLVEEQDMLINSLDEEHGDVQGQEENNGVNPGCKMVEPQTGDPVEEQDVLINSLDEEHGDVQGQEENDGVNPGCKMVEPQTGDPVEEQDVLINSLDEEHGDVQGQEENDGVNPGCKMVEPQTGDLVEAVQLPPTETVPVSETITSFTLGEEVSPRVPKDVQIHDSQEVVESMENTTKGLEQEPSIESVECGKEQTTWKQDVGLKQEVALINDKEYNPADEFSTEGQIDSDEFPALSLHNDVINTKMEDSVVVDTQVSLEILGGDLEVSPESLSCPHVGSVKQIDDLLEVQISPDDSEVITSEESSQDVEATNSVLSNEDLALDSKSTPEGAAIVGSEGLHQPPIHED